MFTRLGLILGAALLLAGTAPAATFTANGGAGSSTIGSGGDYATLADAAADFTGSATPVTGDYTFLITGNLAEPANVSFSKATNGFTVTLRPAPATNPVVTFSQTTDNASPSGHIIVGSLLSAWTLTATDNFVIDGSNTVGGTTRNLTLTNTAATSFPNSRLVRFVGAKNGVVRNCILTNNTTNNAQSCFAVDFTARDAAFPDNGLVENCAITITGGTSCQGVAANVSGTQPANTATTGLVIRNNTITARTRGVFLNVVSNCDILNNVISVRQTAAGVLSHGIYHLSSNATDAWTMNIRNNAINDLRSAANAPGSFGLRGITLEGGPAAPRRGTYNVVNNIISGFNFTATLATPIDIVYNGIFCNGASVDLNVYHNSIHMIDWSAKVSGASANNVQGVIASSTADTMKLDVRNNIIKLSSPAPNAAGVVKGVAQNLTINHNNIVSVANSGRIAGVNYANLAAWQGAGYDLQGKSIDPQTGTTPGVWVSATNLRFTDFPGGLNAGVPIAGITTDVDGTTRDATRPWPGVHEQQVGGVPVNLSGFSID